MTTGLINFVANGTVTVNTQSNITSVGTLAQLTVAGNSNLGAVGNVHITGGNANFVLTTDGSGNLSWVSGGNIANAGTVTNVNTSGSGLGFTLTGGPITTTGTVTLAVPNATSLRSNLTIGNVANLNLNGNGSTYLAGDGSFTVPAGTYSNSNVANYLPTYNGNIGANIVTANLFVGNGSSLTSLTGANVTGTVANATYAISTNLANYATVANSVAGANVSGQVSYAAIANSVAGANVSGQVSYANVANNVAGANVSGTVANATYAVNSGLASLAIQVTSGSQPNITSLGTLSNLSVTGTTITGNANITYANLFGNTTTTALYIPNAQEKALVSATALTGTINYDITTQSIQLYTSNASANWTVNFRGSSSTTLDSIMPSNSVMTLSLITKIGASAYYANAHQVDGNSVTVNWLGNSATIGGYANCKNVYSYSLIKTSGNTFTVLGAVTQFT